MPGKVLLLFRFACFLTGDNRKELVSPIIHEKLLQGYIVQNIPCLKCRMPLMKRNGKVDCQVCPILVNETQTIARAIKVKKLHILEKDLYDANQNVKEAEDILNYDVEQLQELKNKWDWLEKQYVIVTESVKVAQEQADIASKKSKEAHDIVLQAKRLSDQAWAHANKKREMLKITQLDCKATLELFVIRIDHTIKQRQEANDEMSTLVKKAQDDKISAESNFALAKEQCDHDYTDAVNAANAVQQAQMKQKEAQTLYQHAKQHAQSLSDKLQTKAKIVQDTVQQAQETIESFNQKVNLAIQHASTIEKQIEDKVLRAQISKKEAEEQAKHVDESVQYKQVKARVTGRLVHVANENNDKVVKEYEEKKKQLDDLISVNIAKAEENICASDTQLKKLVSLESIAKINLLRRQLQSSGISDDD